MRRSGFTAALLMALILVLALPVPGALAADAFRFEEKSIDLFEGQTAQVPLIREGKPAEEGTITYSCRNPKAVSVAEDGTITAIQKGKSTVQATVTTEKRSWTANLTVNVLRPVTRVTLNTERLKVYTPSDPEISGLLRQETEYDVIVIAAGKSMDLRATCTPADANSKRVVFSSSDEGILNAGRESARAIQAGECDLTVASAQNPEVTQTYHVLVIQPVTRVTVSSPEGKTVNAGETLQLQADTEPGNASIPSVTWKSRNDSIATVDQNGLVTAKKKGTVTIEAEAADGSGKSGSIGLTVAQKVTSVSIRESGINLATGQQGYLHAIALPENANEKGIVWASSDPDIATVNQSGQVKGIRRGECTITATSKSNPSVFAEVPVQIIQRVTQITFDEPVSLPVQTQAQLVWHVYPADATIKDVTFSSNNRKVATVDANGLVSGLTRGSAVITATATDGSNRRGQIRVTVTQPVEGVRIQYDVYHIQLDGSLNVKAIIRPSNANNQNVHFTLEDDYIASVSDQKNIGRVRGWHPGRTTLTGVTEDGGFSDTAEIRVADFNRAIVVDDLYMEWENIRLVLRNRSDFSVDRVYFTVETFNAAGEPLVCNADGVSNFFEGMYRLEIPPEGISEHYMFDFGDYVQPTERIGTVTVTVTGWRDLEGYTRNIPEEQRPTQSFTRFIPPTQVLWQTENPWVTPIPPYWYAQP